MATSPDYYKELDVARVAARKAGDVIQRYQQQNNFSIEFKGKNDLVTDADLKAEETVLNHIRDHFPDDNILAEETARQKQLPGGRTWIVDPIDGTTNFAHGFPVYCVSIALWEDGRAGMGLVLEVSSGELFTAVKGGGARLNDRPISVSPLEDPAHSLIGTGFPYNDMSLLEPYMGVFRELMRSTQGVRRPGSAAYDLCCLACGRYDGFYEYSLNAWDVAAGSLILKEAGGKLSDWEGGDGWLFGQRIVAGNEPVHQFLLEIIRRHFEGGR